MFKRFFFMLFLFFGITSKSYAVYVPTAKISSNHSVNMFERIYSLVMDENGQEQVVIEKCLKEEYLFLNKGEEYCVVKDIISKKEYFMDNFIIPSLAMIIGAIIVYIYSYSQEGKIKIDMTAIIIIVFIIIFACFITFLSMIKQLN